MSNSVNKAGRVIFPLLVHLGISFAVALAASILQREEATLVTVTAGLVSIPVFWKMWKQDRTAMTSAVKKQKRSWLFYGAAFLIGVLASCVSSFLMMQSGIREVFSNQVQEELFSAGLLLQIIGLGVIVPIAEELLYRGLVYERLREMLQMRQAVPVAALIFALSHGNMIQILYALPMALLLHLFYEKSGCLGAPILFHMGANLISVVFNAIGIG